MLFLSLTAVRAAGLHCGSPHFSMLLCYYEIRASPLPVWACGGRGGSIWTMWRLCDVYSIFFADVSLPCLSAGALQGMEIAVAVETDERGESGVSDWLSWLCSHLHVSRETPASLGARAASTRCLTATPPPAQGTSCTSSMCLQKVMCQPANTPAGWPVFEFFRLMLPLSHSSVLKTTLLEVWGGAG